MNLNITQANRKSRKLHGKSNKYYRFRSDKQDNFPNGYVEDWSSISSLSNHKNNEPGSKFDDTHTIRKKCRSHSLDSKKSEKSTHIREFTPVSIILSINSNLLLNKDNSYDVRFNTGMLEGSGICINDTGNIITFQDEGSYRFEISGEGALFSDVEVSLIYFSDKFPDDIKPFSETIIPKDEGKLQLRGIPTILPLQRGQTIIPRLIPTPDESILLLSGTRLLIHRVA